MDMKSILVPLGDELSGTCVEVAMTVARLMDARVVGLHLPAEGRWPWYIDVPPEMSSVSDARLPAAGLEQGFTALCDAAGLACDWIEDQGAASERLAFHSRYADLVVVGRGGDETKGGALSQRALGQLALASSAPLLIVPPGLMSRAFAPQRVLVAWNERREAARAPTRRAAVSVSREGCRSAHHPTARLRGRARLPRRGLSEGAPGPRRRAVQLRGGVRSAGRHPRAGACWRRT